MVGSHPSVASAGKPVTAMTEARTPADVDSSHRTRYAAAGKLVADRADPQLIDQFVAQLVDLGPTDPLATVLAAYRGDRVADPVGGLQLATNPEGDKLFQEFDGALLPDRAHDLRPAATTLGHAMS